MRYMLEIDWKDPEVGVDYIPWSWLQRRNTAAQKHEIFLPSSGEKMFARCTVDVGPGEVILDYVTSSECYWFNKRNGAALGRLKIQFNGDTRNKVIGCYWAKGINGSWKKWNVGYSKVLDSNVEDYDTTGVSQLEGRASLIQHVRRERNSRLVRAKKASVLRKKHCLECEACGFIFSNKYRGVGSDFCEVHHRIPLAKSSMREGRQTSLKQLAILCSNCHRMIHKTKPMESVSKFRKRVVQTPD